MCHTVNIDQKGFLHKRLCCGGAMCLSNWLLTPMVPWDYSGSMTASYHLILIVRKIICAWLFKAGVVCFAVRPVPAAISFIQGYLSSIFSHVLNCDSTACNRCQLYSDMRSSPCERTFLEQLDQSLQWKRLIDYSLGNDQGIEQSSMESKR